MKKLLLILSLCLFLFSACDNSGESSTPELYIRFKNQLTYDGADFNVAYGIRYGSAVYNGQLDHDQVTAYYKATPGNYPLEQKLEDGTWDVVLNEFDSSRLRGYWSILAHGELTVEAIIVFQNNN